VSGSPQASVIVRARDEAADIGRSLELIRRQTVPVEIVVVDSGSVDGTLEIARGLCDRLIRIAPEEFSYGRALNIGAAAATAPVHIAVSAHCFLERSDWVERALALYSARQDVAGIGGCTGDSVIYQDHAMALADPTWGFSNHAGSWRADVWRRYPFDEALGYAEDKEWGLRVTAAGYVLAFAPELYVDLSHSWRTARECYVRARKTAIALRSFAPMEPFGARELLRAWWRDLPEDRHSAAFSRFVNYRRLAGLAGRWAGSR